ncbi:MAG: hypothetical protein BWY59_00585 [Verrucomicrobia bacterium ADurb.Bin345]|nr:MAG: hypothetical protein BWY59_00585 [Verrucomicrobia bacterium ADurb.Bin345]
MTSTGTVYVALVTMSPSVPYELDAGRAALLIDETQLTPSGIVLTWVSQPGTNYTVEVSTNLMGSPAFETLADGIPSFADIWTVWTSPVPAAPASCYRVVEEP